MQSRTRLWIITILLLFVVSFLYAFNPVRRVQQDGFQVQSTFRYAFTQPVADTEEGRLAKAQEINAYLTEKGLELDRVVFVEPSLVEIETLALDDAQAERDGQALLKALTEKYPDIRAAELPEDAQFEQPLVDFGFVGLYSPRPQVRLGLDLIGGAHVVLRCLPETRLMFSSPEDKPMTHATGASTEDTTARFTREQLSENVKSVLVRGGEAEEDIKVSVPGDNLLLVETTAENADIARKQQQLVMNYLESNLPGIEITARDPESVFVESDTADLVMNIVMRRLDSMSDIREPIVQTQGHDRIIVELPGVRDPERVMDILRSTAMLEFRLIPARYEAVGAAQDNYDEWRDTRSGEMVTWERVLAESEAHFTGRDLQSNARVETDGMGGWVVRFELKTERKRAFREFTRRNVGRLMAIVLDNECQMAPVIKSEIPGEGIIEGNFTTDDAQKLRLLLNAGALPVPLEIAENRTISATLGTYSIQRSLTAGIIGIILIFVFMAAYYRLPGLLADIALCLYVLIVLSVLTFTKTTLTLPGIAGIILSIGMAVDANIIIFERLKEELWSGKTMRSAVEAGFERAWTAILDANVTTMIVAAVLYFMGTSSIKSFAVTLFVGVACSLFTAVTVTRWLITIAAGTRLGQAIRLFGGKMESETS